jgi:Uma2 family endonuclease
MAVAGIHRFTVDDFARMGEAGIFTEDDRVELIGGEVRDMAPTSPPHAWAVSRLGELLITRLAGRVHVRVQNPIRLGPHTEPQPDLAVARRTRAYVNRHPDAADVLLVIEVADSSLPFDRSEKAPRYYGRVGIAETWLVDLAARTVTVYSGPGPDGYEREQVLRCGDRIVATAIAELSFPVDDIFA